MKPEPTKCAKCGKRKNAWEHLEQKNPLIVWHPFEPVAPIQPEPPEVSIERRIARRIMLSKEAIGKCRHGHAAYYNQLAVEEIIRQELDREPAIQPESAAYTNWKFDNPHLYRATPSPEAPPEEE